MQKVQYLKHKNQSHRKEYYQYLLSFKALFQSRLKFPLNLPRDKS
jgi:hypothetical protein